MRILHIIESLEFGGAEKVLVELVNAMADHCEIGICCIKRTGDLQASLDARVKVYCLNKAHGNHIDVPFAIARLVREGGYRVVHSHTWGVYLESALGSLLGRAPVLVHTVHGRYLHYPVGAASRAKIAVRHTFERALAVAHRKIVTVSDAIQNYVRSEVGIAPSRLMTIHNGVPEAQLPRRAMRKLREASFVTVGRLHAIKNYEMLLRAFASAFRTYPECRLKIAGDGPERQRLENLARELGLEAGVSFLGFQNDVRGLLGESHVFILSSRYEGISIALLEAMRAGLPAIATRVGGMAEVVQDGKTGILVGNEDEAGMARAMIRLIESPDQCTRMGEQGYAHMMQDFSIRACADRYFALYSA